MKDAKYCAHTKTGPDGAAAHRSEWQPLDEHLNNVAVLVSGFAA